MKLKLVLFMIGMVSLLTAQHTVSGSVKDASSSEALIGANVIVKGTTLGAATDVDGNYTMDLNGGSYTLEAMYVGYVNAIEKINVNKDVTVDFELKSDVFSREVMVTAKRAKLRETPVAFMDIEAEQIEAKIAAQDITMVLNSVPGVYASEQGGGAGDSRINIRGFSTENIAVMINGVPVNDMENGWVYWSNWSGLGDVTSSMQVQRGLGASKLSAASIGGTINVVTKSTDSEQSSMFKTTISDYNTRKFTAAYSTGLLEGNWAMSMMVSKRDGDGYADQTWTDETTYFASIGKLFDEHSINLNIVGTPQKHGQRYEKASISEYKEYGKTFSNNSWGMLNGKKKSVRENFYHKPVIDLNHVWSIDDNTTLNNILYWSHGTGGGKGERSLSRTNGLYDLQAEYDANVADPDGESHGIIRASRNNHTWYGLISSIDKKIENTTLTAGIDARYYKGEHYRTVEDLLGGTNWNDRLYKSFNQDGVSTYGSDDGVTVTRNSGADRKYYDYKEGDKFYYNNDGLVRQYGVFGQIEQKMDDITAFVNASVYQKGYARVDYFSYVDLAGNDVTDETDYENFTGGHLKLGANLNVDEANNVYVNGGYLSIAPQFGSVYIDFVNKLNPDVTNEKVLSGEIGYGYQSSVLAVNANMYLTKWDNRYYRIRSGSNSFVFKKNGVSQLHQGLELDVRYKPTSSFDIEGSLAYSENKFTENRVAQNVDEDNTQDPEVTVYLKDLHIPDQPAITANFGVTYNHTVSDDSRFYINPRMRYSADMFSLFGATSRFLLNEATAVDTWKVPSYTVGDLTIGYTMDLNSTIKSIGFTFNLSNMFDKEYIVEAQGDGTDDGTDVYYGLPKRWSLGMKLDF